MNTIEPSVFTNLIGSDRWMSADECALFFGLLKNKGEPNRRAFYNKVSRREGFPAPLLIGGERKWRKSEIDLWSRDERLKQQLESPSKSLAQTTVRQHTASESLTA